METGPGGFKDWSSSSLKPRVFLKETRAFPVSPEVAACTCGGILWADLESSLPQNSVLWD